jgi:outer membrane protein assembly factor BamB
MSIGRLYFGGVDAGNSVRESHRAGLMMTHQFMCLSGDLSDDLRPLRPGRGANAKGNGLTTRARRLVGGATVALAGLALAVSPGAAQERDEAPPQQKEPAADDQTPANPVTEFFKGLLGGKPEKEGSSQPAEEPVEDTERPGHDLVDGRAASVPRYVKNLSLAETKAREGDWHEASRLLQEIIDLPEDTLWQRPDGRWVSLQSEAETQVGNLASEGRAEYRAQHDGLAQRMLDEAAASTRSDALFQVASRYFHTDAGYRSADVIAASYFDRGEFSLAARWYARLWGARPALTERPEWRAKAAYAFLQAGRADAVQAIAAVGGEGPPGASLAATGRRTVSEWLGAQSLLPAAPPLPLTNWPTFGGNPSRSGVSADGDPLLLERWSLPLTNRFAIDRQIDDLLLDLSDNQRAGIPSFVPLVVSGKVAFRTLRGLAVADVQTGRILWETAPGVSAERLLSGEADDSSIATPRPVVRPMIADYGANQLDQHPLAGLLYRDGVYGLLSSDGARLYSIEQQAIMAQSNYGYRWGGSDPSAQDPYGRDWSTNQIVAFDFLSGRSLWEVGGRKMHESFDPPLAGTYFFGPPVADGGELFAIGERNNEVRLYVLSPQTGELLWSQPLANVSAKVELDFVRRMWECQPAVNAGMIVCPTGAGWLVALDRQTHRIVWAQRYAARQDQSRHGRGMSMNSLQRLNERWCSAAPILVDGRVLFTPAEQPDETGQDLPRLICFDALTGDVVWQQDKGSSALYLAGVAEGAVVVVGRDFVRALSLADEGKTLWNIELSDRDGPPSGRAILSRERLFVPLQSGELWTINVTDGRVPARMQLPPGSKPLGNLAFHAGTLVSLSPRALTGFEQRPEVERQIAARRALDPADLKAAVLEAASRTLDGDYAGALQSLDSANPESADSDPDLQMRRRRLTRTCLLAIARTDLGAHDVEFNRAARLADSVADRVEIGRLDADRRVQRGDLPGAFDALWELTRQPSDTTVTDGDVVARLDSYLAGRLLDLWRVAAPDVRVRIDQRIGDEVQVALDDSRQRQLRVERLCGFHPAAQPLVWALIDAAAEARDFAGAEVRLRRLAADNDPHVVARAILRLAELLLEYGQPAEAARCFLELESLGDVALAEWTAAEEARNAFATGRASRELLVPPSIGVWSDHDFEIVRTRTQYTQFYGQETVIERGDREFFQSFRLQFDPHLHLLTFISTDEEAGRWSVPLRTSHANSYNEAVAVLADGLRAAVVHDGMVHALSFVDQRLLWTQPLADRAANMYARQIYDPGVAVLHQAGSFVSQSGLARARAATGMLALATSRYIACYGRGEILVLDPLTGEPLWRRRGIAPQTVICGDERTIYVLPRGGTEPYAVRTVDGRPLEFPDLSARIGRAVALRPRGLVLVDADSRAGSTLRANREKLSVACVRADNGDKVWDREFDKRSRLALLDDHSLLVLDESAACHLLDLDSGDVKSLGSLPADLFKANSQVHAVADAETIFVLIDHLKNAPFSHVSQPAVRINGTVFALPRDGSGLAWQKQVENQNLLLSQFGHSPLLIFLSYRYVPVEKIQTGLMKVDLLAVDKRTGRTAAESIQYGNGGGNYQLRLNLAERYFEVRSHNERIRVQATSAPGAQASLGRDPARAGPSRAAGR